MSADPSNASRSVLAAVLALTLTGGVVLTPAAHADTPNVASGWSGTWRENRSFAAGAIVQYDKALWIATRANTGKRPSVSPRAWSLLLPAVPGPKGPKGATGATGAAGAVGATGVTGAAGATGVTGAPGVMGAPGGTGTAGQDGAVGATGATGPMGLPGATGATGDVGTTGAAGATGAPGAIGATGAAGATGATGVTGAQGIQGMQGPMGPAGADGATGATGATGAAGATGQGGGHGVTGPAGPTGPDGVTGPAGETGPAGTSSEALIPFSTSSPVTLSTLTGGNSLDGAALGFGQAETAPYISPNVLDFTGNNLAAYMVPEDGRITAISALFSATAAVAMTGEEVTLEAQLYESTSDNFFTPKSEAVTFGPISGAIAVGDVVSGSRTGLSVPVTAGKRLALVVRAYSETGFSGSFAGRWSAGVSIAAG